MTTRRGSQYSIQSDGAGLRGKIDSSKGKRKGNIPSGIESTQGSSLSQRQVPEMPTISEPELELSMGGQKGRSPSSFYQKASSQPTSPKGEEEQEKELEETIFPMLQDSKNPKRCHGQGIQHGQNLDGIQRQGGAKNETTQFPKEITLSPDALNTLKELKDSILPLKDIKNIIFTRNK
ncbi:hypothetical protein O181_108285 [Austropuccinia psidii MF-1]|uniref:Uncharacterized protein n=1 Tax=Austropuccinia psidii MF-1 TaxID=1389203 RepID=A0A9Q3JW50_9BASI|nr:hypothetical protein [Austropuccinia psidii MF-1]